MATRLWLKGALAAGAAAWLAGDVLAQGRPGGGAGQGGGGRCGGGNTSQLNSGAGMAASLRGSVNPGALSQLQGANPAALTQQLAAQQALINQLQAQLQAVQMQGGSRQTGQQQTAQLRTAPRPSADRAASFGQGATRAEEWSPVWSSVTTDLTPNGTVTPAAAPVPMAVSPSLLLAYQTASGLKDKALARKYLDGEEAVLVETPLPVSVETRFRGLAYVRPTEGRFAGKFLVVDARYVK